MIYAVITLYIIGAYMAYLLIDEILGSESDLFLRFGVTVFWPFYGSAMAFLSFYYRARK